MEAYLDNYSKYISNSKKSISIANSDEYISAQEFDIEIIAKHYESHINLKSIFNLLGDNHFYQGHNEAEKHKLLLQSLEILYNYSKNLLANFSIYSTKSIQEVNTNIKDFLRHLPLYSDYLSTLLGYEFDPVKREWSIKQKSLGRQRRLHLAAVCVLCTYARSVLSETEIMDNGRSDSTNNHEDHNSIDDDDTASTKWQCDICGVLNGEKALNCEVCYTSRSRPEERPHSPPTSKLSASRQVSDSSYWECIACTFMNPLDKSNCDVCDALNPQTGSDSRWKCESCEYRNPSKTDTCSICGGLRHKRDSMHSRGGTMNNNQSLINDSHERVDRINKPIKQINNSHERVDRINKPIKQINNSNPHLHEMDYNHFSRKSSPPQGARARGGEVSYPSDENEEINGIDYGLDIEKRPKRGEKEKVRATLDMTVDATKKKYGVGDEDQVRQPSRAIDSRVDAGDKHQRREEQTRPGVPASSQTRKSNTLESPWAPQTARSNKPAPNPGRAATKTKDGKSASSSPKGPDKVPPGLRGGSMQKRNKNEVVATAPKCASCALDHKGRLIDDTKKKIKKCPVCQRRGKTSLLGNCFGKS